MSLFTRLRSTLFFAAGGMAVVASVAIAQFTTQQSLFSDVPNTSYFGESVSDLTRLGIVRGYDNGKFGPLDFVTRGQVAVLISRYDAQVIDSLRLQVMELRVNAGLGTCGDGRVQSGEQCDDGNRVDSDGCSKECLLEATGRFAEPPATVRRCISSIDCMNGQVCSTAYGDCESACLPGGPSCIQVCTGTCVSPRGEEGKSCEPHVCSDGRVHPSCTEDGHPINYFADPCLTSGGAASSKPSSMGSMRSSSRSSSEAATGTCADERQEFGLLSQQSKSCVASSDCVLYEQSCPYVTCGEAVNKGALRKLQEQAQKVLITCQNEGLPQECVSCAAQTVSCVSGKCTTKPR